MKFSTSTLSQPETKQVKQASSGPNWFVPKHGQLHDQLVLIYTHAYAR